MPIFPKGANAVIKEFPKAANTHGNGLMGFRNPLESLRRDLWKTMNPSAFQELFYDCTIGFLKPSDLAWEHQRLSGELHK